MLSRMIDEKPVTPRVGVFVEYDWRIAMINFSVHLARTFAQPHPRPAWIPNPIGEPIIITFIDFAPTCSTYSAHTRRAMLLLCAVDPSLASTWARNGFMSVRAGPPELFRGPLLASYYAFLCAITHLI